MPALEFELRGSESECRDSTQREFTFEEATVGNVHEAFANGALWCTQSTGLYLERIEAYNFKRAAGSRDTHVQKYRPIPKWPTAALGAT